MSTWKYCKNSARVISPWISNRSHSVHLLPQYSRCGAAIGSLKPKKGKARLTKPFLNGSMLFWDRTSLYSSRHTKPATTDVVVAIAGIILPTKTMSHYYNKFFVVGIIKQPESLFKLDVLFIYTRHSHKLKHLQFRIDIYTSNKVTEH